MNDEIIMLEYSERQHCFYYNSEPEKSGNNTWAKLKLMSLSDAIAFCTQMERKYEIGRKTGKMPSLEIVKTELTLFFQLKSYRRKLV